MERKKKSTESSWSIIESKEIDETRSLFALPITRFWALHYDLSNHLID